MMACRAQWKMRWPFVFILFFPLSLGIEREDVLSLKIGKNKHIITSVTN